LRILHDVRYAIRLLRNSPGFSVVAIATIALAIGANAAMFSFVNGALLSPLPYPDSDRIVRVLETRAAGGINGISTLNYLDWAGQNAVFEYIAAETGWRATLTGGDEPVVIRGARVSAHYFDIFGVKAARGRTFLPDEDQPGKDHVVLVSHALWEGRFSSDPAILERSIMLNGEAHTVVGVLPKGGPFDRAAAQIWKPLAFQPSNMTRDFRWLGASAKLKAGMSLGTARAGMDLVAQRLARAYPESNKGWGVAVDRLADVLIGPELHAAVAILFAATLFVLLIGCVNLTNLTLARAVSRESEMAARSALGAGRSRLVRQALVENLVISLCGGIVAFGVGYALLKWIKSLIPPYALPPAVDISMSVPVLLFTLAVAVVTGVLIGSAAAVRSSNPDLTSALKAGRHGTTAVSPGKRIRPRSRCGRGGARVRPAGRFGTADAKFLQPARGGSRIQNDERPDGESPDRAGAAPRPRRTEHLSGFNTRRCPDRAWRSRHGARFGVAAGGLGIRHAVLNRRPGIHGPGQSTAGVFQDREPVVRARARHRPARGARPRRERHGGRTAGRPDQRDAGQTRVCREESDRPADPGAGDCRGPDRTRPGDRLGDRWRDRQRKNHRPRR
jgi:hypothetical protein